MENKQCDVQQIKKETEGFLEILENCTPAQKQYFAGGLDGMRYSNAERRLSAPDTDTRSA